MYWSYNSTSSNLLIAPFRQTPGLRRLKLHLELFLSGNQLQKIIVTHLPKLECFNFKMNFQVELRAKGAVTVDQILNTFQSPFWREEHQWFVRCEPSKEQTHLMRVSTIAYLFDKYVRDKHLRSKSTLPKGHLSQSSTIRTGNLCFRNPLGPLRPNVYSFTNVRHLGMDLSCADGILALIPKLDQLSSILIDFQQDEDTCAQFQILLDRAIPLRRMLLQNLFDFDKLLNLKSRPIDWIVFSNTLCGRLFFQSKRVYHIGKIFPRAAMSFIGDSIENIKMHHCTRQIYAQSALVAVSIIWTPEHTHTHRWETSTSVPLVGRKRAGALWYKRRSGGWVIVFWWICWSIDKCWICPLLY